MLATQFKDKYTKLARNRVEKRTRKEAHFISLPACFNDLPSRLKWRYVPVEELEDLIFFVPLEVEVT